MKNLIIDSRVPSEKITRGRIEEGEERLEPL